jgi:hypothetical protein
MLPHEQSIQKVVSHRLGTAPRRGAQEEASETTGGSSWSRWKGIQPPNPKASRLAVTHGEGFLRNRWWA